jgi:hypothetical protein
MLKHLQTRSLKNTICHFQQKVINYFNSILNIIMQFSVDDKKNSRRCENFERNLFKNISDLALTTLEQVE